MKPKIKRLDGKNKLVPLTKRMETDMRSFCRDKGIESENELIRQAIGKYIYADYKDETLKLQGLTQMQNKLSELRDMIDILFRYICLMHTSILAYHPEIDSSMTNAAFASAKNRNDKFFNAFQNNLKDEPPFFERLLHNFYSEDLNGQG